MSELLNDWSIHQAGIKPMLHPRLQAVVNAQTAVRYLRFLRPVVLERLELRPVVYGRWVPNVPTHPAHLTIATLDPATLTWKTIREVDLPPDPRIAGKGLSQAMTMDAMNAHFAALLKEPPQVIELGGLRTDHLRVECDREHPQWPNHGECNGGEFNVPFGILNGLQAFGTQAQPDFITPAYLPGVKLQRLQPQAPKVMTIRRPPQQVVFVGKKLTVGFSLNRPLLTHLGWDVFGRGGAGLNRLSLYWTQYTCGLSGPVLRTLGLECLPQYWTGTVSVQGNKVAYRNLRCAVPGVRLDAVFTVEPERLILSVTQTVDAAVPALEAAVWQLNFNEVAAATAVAGEPVLQPGRNGEVALPALWAGDGVGCLASQQIAGPAGALRLQVESYHSAGYDKSLSGALVFGPRPVPPACLSLAKGRQTATVEWRVTNLEPVRRRGTARPSYGLASNWAAVYSCFRPEYGGFSNSAVSVNCHVNQHGPAEVVAFTQRPAVGPNLLNLLRFSVGRALMDGGGYGYWRNLYLDSDPVLVSTAGRCHQTEPLRDWLRQIEPGLRESIQRILGTIGPAGLAVCRDLTGNSGSYRWSSNAMDVVGFGHLDAYVNAFSYRALRNATAMMHDLGDEALAGRCREAAAGLRQAFARQLLNPKTGWVAGWRSQDGELHDYAFMWVNGPAIAFGLLDAPVARQALQGLERLRRKVGAGHGQFGVPFNLLPIRNEDHMLPQVRPRGRPTFETYTDGAMAYCGTGYYLRALSIYGLKAAARKLAGELDEGYAAGLATSGVFGAGVEFKTWGGLPSGYEGTFVVSFIPLYGMAIEQGLFAPPSPEWWPAGG